MVPHTVYREFFRPRADSVEVMECVDQPFDSESTGSPEDTDLIPIIQGKTGLRCLMTMHHIVIVDFVGNFPNMDGGQRIVSGAVIAVASS